MVVEPAPEEVLLGEAASFGEETDPEFVDVHGKPDVSKFVACLFLELEIIFLAKILLLEVLVHQHVGEVEMG